MRSHLEEFTNFSEHNIQVTFNKSSRLLAIEFRIETQKDFNTSNEFSLNSLKNWGLWEYDVFEVFLQPRLTRNDVKAPYLEFQISPLNQKFALIIYEPRRKYRFLKESELLYQTKSQLQDNKWTVQLEIELPSSLHGIYLYGNITACLGKKNRSFYTYNKISKLDFHQPHHFSELVSTSIDGLE